MIRLFVGLSLPHPLRDRLAALAAGIPGARWTPSENLHVTLRFIGEVDETTADGVHDALVELRAAAFDLEIGGCGLFTAPRRSFTLWVGASKAPPLVHLRDKIESALVRAGLPPEGRRYQPHITLARLKDPPLSKLHAFVAGNNLFRAAFHVDTFTLFSSRLGHGDPVYTAEVEYPLQDYPTSACPAGK